MTTETTKVLKEWATVLQALATGQQIMVFRKGGIIEKHDVFEVESPEFFLYPTYVHQQHEKLQPTYHSWVDAVEQQRPGSDKIEIKLYAKVTKVLEAKGVERLRELTDTHIWAPEFVEKAWAWAPEKPAYILFLRVFKLENPYVIEEKPEYGGCVSWIDLQDALPITGLHPILSDTEYDEKCRTLEKALGNTITPSPV